MDGNTVDPLPLTVALEAVGVDQVRAKVPAGAPFEMHLPVTVTDGALAGGVTTLTVAAGAVASTPVTVYRTAGTSGAVTVDLGTPLPAPPESHWGYVLTPAASGLPVTVPDPQIATVAPVEVAENTTAVLTLRASDAGGGTVTWSKTGGADAARFALTAAGVLTFVSAPDYEAPADVASANPRNDAANNEYVVFVTASDGTEMRLLVRVANVNEAPTAGTVTIAGMTPAVGVTLTATVAGLVDPDGLPEPFTTLSWQWYRTPEGGSETVISGAIGATYTAAATDLGAALTAKASWTDLGGFDDNTLASIPTAAVLPNVTIAAERASYTAGLDDVVFTLSRWGVADTALEVAVALTQDQALLPGDSLAPTVRFEPGDPTAQLRLPSHLFADSAVTQDTHPDGHPDARHGLRARHAQRGQRAPGGGQPGRHRAPRAANLHLCRERQRHGRHRHRPHRARRAAAHTTAQRRFPAQRGDRRRGPGQRYRLP